MRFLVLVKATPESEGGGLPSAEMLAKMGKFNEEMVKAGIMLAAEGLQPSSKGVRISYAGGKPAITDGPFAETKELIAGFWLIAVKSKAEAVEWMSRAPFDNESIELRAVFEMEDLVAVMTPEIRERDERLRAQVGAQT